MTFMSLKDDINNNTEKEYLIPAIKDVVKYIKIDDKTIIEPIEGWLNENRYTYAISKFTNFIDASIIGRAVNKNIVTINCINRRFFQG